MTKFEEEIRDALKKHRQSNIFKGATHIDIDALRAKAAAEVAKKYIEKAFKDAKQMEPYLSTAERYPDLKEWLKENGVV